MNEVNSNTPVSAGQFRRYYRKWLNKLASFITSEEDITDDTQIAYNATGNEYEWYDTDEIDAIKTDLLEQKKVDDWRWDFQKGQIWDFDTDDNDAYSVDIPTGAHLSAVEKIGGKSVVRDGEVIHADVKSVKEMGVNLWDEEWELGTLNANGNNYDSSTRIRSKNYIDVEQNTSYRLVTTKETAWYWYDANKTIISYNWITGLTTRTSPSNAKYLRFTVNGITTYNHDIAIIKGTSGSYTPYHTTTKAIPNAIRNLDGYGWSAGSVYNYIDFERKVFVKRVGKKVYDGTTTKVLSRYCPEGSSIARFADNEAEDISVFKPNSYYLADKLIRTTKTDLFATPEYSIGNANNPLINRLWFYVPSTFESNDAINEWLKTNPITVFFELATPTETDISDYLTDDFILECEPHGTLTFVNDNLMAVPTTEKYTIKLSEV